MNKQWTGDKKVLMHLSNRKFENKNKWTLTVIMFYPKRTISLYMHIPIYIPDSKEID